MPTELRTDRHTLNPELSRDQVTGPETTIVMRIVFANTRLHARNAGGQHVVVAVMAHWAAITPEVMDVRTPENVLPT